jgi:5,10-methylenetetrahydromethanopterin reductase
LARTGDVLFDRLMTGPRLGVSIAPQVPPARIGAVARDIEEAGADEVWLAEDCFFAGGIAAASAALAATRHVTVGLGILPAAVRNAAFTAMELAALAELYPGRIVAGLGHGMAGWMRQIGAYPRSPLTSIGEHLRTVRALLAGDEVTVDGDYVRLDAVRLDHPPAAVPAVLAGVRGPKSLAVAGRDADGVLLAWPVAREYVDRSRALVEQAWRAAGRAGRPTVVVASPVSVDPDPVLARERLRGRVAAELSLSSSDAHLEPLGILDEVVALRGAGDFARRLPAAWIDRLTIAGDAAGCAARIADLRAAGVDAVVLDLAGGQSPGEVIPALRDSFKNGSTSLP